MTLTASQLKVLSASIFHYFRAMDNPPAQEMFIPIAAIRPDKKEKNTFFATIRYVIEYCGRKENSVRIKFNVDDTGRFLNNTWQYV